MTFNFKQYLEKHAEEDFDSDPFSTLGENAAFTPPASPTGRLPDQLSMIKFCCNSLPIVEQDTLIDMLRTMCQKTGRDQAVVAELIRPGSNGTIDDLRRMFSEMIYALDMTSLTEIYNKISAIT